GRLVVGLRKPLFPLYPISERELDLFAVHGVLARRWTLDLHADVHLDESAADDARHLESSNELVVVMERHRELAGIFREHRASATVVERRAREIAGDRGGIGVPVH